MVQPSGWIREKILVVFFCTDLLQYQLQPPLISPADIFPYALGPVNVT